MERLRGSWLGIAVVLTLFGLLMLAAAVRDIAIVLFFDSVGGVDIRHQILCSLASLAQRWG